MSKTLTTYRMTIETLTPVHIGTGTVLLNNYDFKVDGGKTYRLHVDRVLDYLWPEDVDAMPAAERDKLMRTPPGELLTAKDLQEHPELVLYVMAGAPQVTGREAGQIREQIKDVFGRLYIPGSTIKGAIRTALARYLVGKIEPNPMLQIQGARSAKQADDRLDAKLFRPGTDSANYDLLRALRVADSEPVEAAPILANVRVFRGKTGQSPIEVEAIDKGTRFTARIGIDEYLLGLVKPHNASGKENGGKDDEHLLGWKDKHIGTVRRFKIACLEHARSQLLREISYFDRLNAPEFSEILRELKDYLAAVEELMRTKGNAFLLRIGWAGGWENKTLGSEILAADAQAFRQLRVQFGLGRPPGRGGSWTPSKEFPLSRRLVVDEKGRPAAPMGWVLVRLEKES